MENKNGYLEAALIAAVIFLVGDAVCSQGSVVALTQALIAAALGMLAGALLLRGDADRARAVGARAAVFMLALILTRGFDFANDRMARGRAETIVAACDAYKARNGAYPDSLQALVPGYLKEVPRARFTVLWSSFDYGQGKLAWTVVPLAVMPSYDFAAAKWSFSMRDALPVVLGK